MNIALSAVLLAFAPGDALAGPELSRLESAAAEASAAASAAGPDAAKALASLSADGSALKAPAAIALDPGRQEQGIVLWSGGGAGSKGGPGSWKVPGVRVLKDGEGKYGAARTLGAGFVAFGAYPVVFAAAGFVHGWGLGWAPGAVIGGVLGLVVGAVIGVAALGVGLVKGVRKLFP